MRNLILRGIFGVAIIMAFNWMAESYLKSSINRREKIPSAQIDNEFYGSVSWWDTESPMHILQKMNQARVPYFARHIKAGGTVLDVGCGGGFLSEELARLGFIVTGVDASDGAIQAAREHAKESHYKLVYQVASAYSLPFLDSSFDSVVVSDVLEHLLDLPQAIREIHRVLKPGGTLLFDTINRSVYSVVVTWFLAQELLHVVPHAAHDWKLFIRPEELRDLLIAAGFDVVDETWAGIQEEVDLMMLMRGKSIAQSIIGFQEVQSMSSSYMGWARKS